VKIVCVCVVSVHWHFQNHANHLKSYSYSMNICFYNFEIVSSSIRLCKRALERNRACRHLFVYTARYSARCQAKREENLKIMCRLLSRVVKWFSVSRCRCDPEWAWNAGTIRMGNSKSLQGSGVPLGPHPPLTAACSWTSFWPSSFPSAFFY